MNAGAALKVARLDTSQAKTNAEGAENAKGAEQEGITDARQGAFFAASGAVAPFAFVFGRGANFGHGHEQGQPCLRLW